MGAPSILFAPASGPEVGGGHVMRGAALATALAARGARCAFAVTAQGASILQRFFPDAFAAHAVDRGDVAGLSALAARVYADAVVLDDYAVSDEQERRLAAPGRILMAIDDLADRAHAVDVLLDPGYGRREADYAALAPGAALAVGPTYALLRPGFAQPLPERSPGPLKRLFVSFGLSDVGGIAARAVALARAFDPLLAFDIALSSDAPSRAALDTAALDGDGLDRDGAVTLHVETRDVVGLMEAADAALGAGGSSTWERCAIGLPTLAVIVADNQRALIETLDREGVLIGCDLAAPDFEARFFAGLEALRDPERRRTLSERSRALCDGGGAERAADVLLAAIRARS